MGGLTCAILYFRIGLSSSQGVLERDISSSHGITRIQRARSSLYDVRRRELREYRFVFYQFHKRPSHPSLPALLTIFPFKRGGLGSGFGSRHGRAERVVVYLDRGLFSRTRNL